MSVRPLTIGLALAYARSNQPDLSLAPNVFTANLAVIEQDWMFQQGLLAKAPEGSPIPYIATDKLRAWVRFICETPLPVAHTEWRLPEREG